MLACFVLFKFPKIEFVILNGKKCRMACSIWIIRDRNFAECSVVKKNTMIATATWLRVRGNRIRFLWHVIKCTCIHTYVRTHTCIHVNTWLHAPTCTRVRTRNLTKLRNTFGLYNNSWNITIRGTGFEQKTTGKQTHFGADFKKRICILRSLVHNNM